MDNLGKNQVAHQYSILWLSIGEKCEPKPMAETYTRQGTGAPANNYIW